MKISLIIYLCIGGVGLRVIDISGVACGSVIEACMSKSDGWSFRLRRV